ncbi:MAG: RHS repeat domain-containing protein [Pseudomonadota bacterium]
MRTKITVLFLALGLVLPIQLMAQAVSLPSEYGEKIKAATSVSALDSGAFGESVNDATGNTVFSVVDIDLPGNNALPVRLGRRLPIEPRYIQEELGGLGNWDIDVPYIETTVSSLYGWSVDISTSPNRYKRCSIVAPPKVEGTIFSSGEVSHGYRVHIPGVFEGLMLKHANNHANPTDGRTYPWVVGESGRVSCLSSIKNGAPGEGFVVHLADGTRYYFDYPVERTAPILRKGPKTVTGYSMPRKRVFMLATRIEDRYGNSVDFQYGAGQLSSVTGSDGRQIVIQSTQNGYVATANGRQWQYELANGHLARVVNPDGSKWAYSSFGTYQPRPEYDGESIQIESFSPSEQCLAAPSFSEYVGGASFVVEHPSGMRGEFSFTNSIFSRSRVPYRCVVDYFDHQVRLNSWLLPPNRHNEDVLRRAIRDYKSCIAAAGPTNDPQYSQNEAVCASEFMSSVQSEWETPTEPDEASASISGYAHMMDTNAYPVLSLSRLTTTGHGLSSRVTQYSYLVETYQYCGLINHFTGQPDGPTCDQDPCAGGGCLDSTGRWTEIVLPSGDKVRKRYGVVYGVNEGKLLEEQVISAQGVLVRHVLHQYLDGANTTTQLFARRVGWAFTSDPIEGLLMPWTSTEIRESGSSFVSEIPLCSGAGAYCFDALARPTKVRKSSPYGAPTTNLTEYHDDLTRWVVGQQRHVTNVETGLVESEVGYNAQALPVWTKKFGKLQQTMTYNTDGTLATVADGRGNVTAFSNWKGGIPRLISHPGGATESATVDDNGWITSITDENGFVTGYGYDAMGRLASTVYPTGDTLAGGATAYHTTWSEFRALTDTDWKPAGVSTGQWRQVQGTGDHVTVTYLNALWQPVLVHDYDQANVASTLRSTRTEYDSNSRVSFQSYPTSDLIPGAIGTRTFYDALDRVVRVEQDSELGVQPLATTTEYLSGLRTRVTNPRGQQVTTSFMAWDQPGYDLPILSEQPEGKVIQIQRHPQFGWPLTLTQRNAANTLSATRRYVYDVYAQLCKTIEPETGATVTEYDAAGNVDWTAAGLTGGDYADTAACSRTPAGTSGRKVSRTYDTRNRLSQLLFPDGRGNQALTYTPDGLPASITTYNGTGNTEPVVMAYTYNKRRLLTGESITQYNGASPWYTWTIGYAYNAYGHLASQTYPTGLTVDYAPNPLGQATKAGAYASGAQYYPNGALKHFTYGNGIVHTMQQNVRQLPSRVTSSGGVNDFTYNYDANGNVTNIWDLARGDNYSRWLSYDNLDRLTAAGSASFGGDHWHRMTYDVLDNLESWKLAGVKDYADYVYDSQNRLMSIRNTAGATVVGLDYDPQGNLWNKNGQTYDFDYGNRLRRANGKETYRYDGLGRRVQTTSDNGKTTLWQYSQGGQMLFSSDWGGPDNQAQQTHENVYLAGSIIATIDHAWPSNAVLATKYQHTDALGSPVAVTNAAGQVTERMDYEPWGAIIGNPTRSGIGYTGHVMDGATGLTYMQQRYYDQSVGRFLSVDPVTAYEKPGSNFNRYWYANNSPHKFVDPDGRQSRDDVWIPPTNIPYLDWGTSSSDRRISTKQLVERQLAFELSRERSWEENLTYIATAMSLASRGLGFRGGNLRSMSGPARYELGKIRERYVARLVGGRVSGERVTVQGYGTTDIDVTAANGDLVAVGGAAKARNKGNLGRMLRIYNAIAAERGVGVRAYFEEGTPKEIIDYARKVIGRDNVRTFKDSK